MWIKCDHRGGLLQLLGPNARVGYWARCLVLVDGIWTQKDRMGRPASNTVFNHGADKNTFNSIPPTEDRSLFLDKFIAVLEGAPFNRDAATATTLASRASTRPRRRAANSSTRPGATSTNSRST